MVLQSPGVARVGESTWSSGLQPAPMKCCGHERGSHRAIVPDGFRLCRVSVEGQTCLCRKLAY
jgi:hypothetical protein